MTHSAECIPPAVHFSPFAPQEELDEFFDAKSLLGSLQSSCALFFASAHESLGSYGSGSQYQSQYQSQYHSHYSSLGGSPRGGGGGGAALEGGPAGAAGVEVSLYQAHDLAASVRQVRADAQSLATPVCECMTAVLTMLDAVLCCAVQCCAVLHESWQLAL